MSTKQVVKESLLSGLSVSGIAKHTGISIGTVIKNLRTLVGEGALDFSEIYFSLEQAQLKRCGFKRSGVHILRHTFGAHLAQKGVDMAVIRDLLGHHSVTLTEKYYAHLAPSSLTSAVQRLHNKENLLPKLLPKTDFAPFSGTKNGEGEVPLTDSFERCYVPEVALLAGVAKLAYAADSKSLANGDSTTSKTCRNLSKTSFKPRTGAGFSPIYRARMGESYRKFIGDK